MASMIVDGVATTLAWVDPMTWAFNGDIDVSPTKAHRQLILSESPFMLLDGTSLRFKRVGKNGPILLAKASNATLTIVTAEGKISAKAEYIHFSSTSEEILLVGCRNVASGAQRYAAEVWSSAQMTFNWRKNRLSCANKITMN